MIFEYASIKDDISIEVKSLEKTLLPALAEATWTLSEVAIRSLLEGVLHNPAVSGVRLIDDTENIMSELGITDQTNNAQFLDNTFSKKFDVIYEGNRAGTLIVFTTNKVVFHRFKYGFILVLISSLIKTSALWLVINFFTIKILKTPLAHLTRQVNLIDQDRLVHINPQYKKENELTKFSAAINGLIDRISDYQSEIKFKTKALDDHKNNLEITVKKRTAELADKNEKLIKTQKKLVAQEKLAALGSLTTGIAHEINNPLNLIFGSYITIQKSLSSTITKTLKQMKNSSDQSAKEISIIEEEVAHIENLLKIVGKGSQRIDNIVKNMLAQSDHGNSDIVNTDIRKLVEESLTHTLAGREESFKQKVAVNWNTDTDLPHPPVFANHLSRAFTNIFENAFDAYSMNPEAKNYDNYRLTISIARKLDKITISIKDFGLGIENNILENVCEPFFTTKPTGQGTGLGLSMAHAIIVQQHDGTLDVSSQAGKFTEVRIELPTET